MLDRCRRWTRGGTWVLISGMSGGGNLVLGGILATPAAEPGTQNRLEFLSSFSDDGAERVRYREYAAMVDLRTSHYSESEQVPSFWWASAMGPDGRVYAAGERDRYAITVFNRDGSIDRVIEREFESWRRTEAEVEWVRSLFDSADSEIRSTYDIEDHAPDVALFQRGVRVAPDGTLWVVSSRGIREQPPGIMLTYDVFDPDGHFTRQVAMACEGDGISDGLVFVGEDRVVWIRGYVDALAAQFGRGTPMTDDDGEPALPEIICLQIVR